MSFFVSKIKHKAYHVPLTNNVLFNNLYKKSLSKSNGEASVLVAPFYGMEWGKVGKKTFGNPFKNSDEKKRE